MCRLSASIGIQDTAFRRLLMHQLMLASNADGQRDGSGVTDGDVLAKSATPFVEFGGQWIRWLDANKPWVGHVRAASRNTRITSYEAHPFRLPIDRDDLVAAHNGFIAGMPEPLRGEPMVDSYQAFKLLRDRMHDSGEINADVINSWTSEFGPGSQWAFMMIHNNTLHVARGNREMHALSVDGGWLFNTSPAVLLHVKEWAQTYWGNRYKYGRIIEIKPHKLVSVQVGDKDLKLVDINPSPVDAVVAGKYYTWRQGEEEKLISIE